MAGAKGVVQSLWSCISWHNNFMCLFYQELYAGNTVERALRQAAVQWATEHPTIYTAASDAFCYTFFYVGAPGMTLSRIPGPPKPSPLTAIASRIGRFTEAEELQREFEMLHQQLNVKVDEHSAAHERLRSLVHCSFRVPGLRAVANAVLSGRLHDNLNLVDPEFKPLLDVRLEQDPPGSATQDYTMGMMCSPLQKIKAELVVERWLTLPHHSESCMNQVVTKLNAELDQAYNALINKLVEQRANRASKRITEPFLEQLALNLTSKRNQLIAQTQQELDIMVQNAVYYILENVGSFLEMPPSAPPGPAVPQVDPRMAEWLVLCQDNARSVEVAVDEQFQHIINSGLQKVSDLLHKMQELECTSLEQALEVARSDLRDKLLAEKPLEKREDAKKKGLEPSEVETQGQLEEQYQRNIIIALWNNTLHALEKLKKTIGQKESLPQALFCLGVHLVAAEWGPPIYVQSYDMLQDMRNSQVLAVPSDTGSGKSTLLPALMMAEFGSCVVTQPRIMPCKNTASFVGSLFGEELVGCEWAGRRETKPTVKLLYCTHGIFKMLVHGAVKKGTRYRHEIVFVDEVHERSTNIDLVLMGLAMMIHRSQLGQAPTPPKVIVASATLDKAVLDPFKNQGVTLTEREVTVPSPFEVKTILDYVSVHYVRATADVFRTKKADEKVLCFVPGTGDATKAAEAFKALTGTQAYELNAQQTPEVVNNNLSLGSVFFSTNIAETSLTIKDLAHVVDLGKSKKPSISTDQINNLITEYAPQSTCTQRKGRCGRVRPGCYYPIYDQSDITKSYPKPQVLCIDMLPDEFSMWQFHGMGMLELIDFHPAGTDPEFRSVAQQARTLLQQMGVLSSNPPQLTELGVNMTLLPEVGSVRNRRVLVEAINHGIGSEMFKLTIGMMSLPNRFNHLFELMPHECKDKELGDGSTLYRFMSQLIHEYEKGLLDPFLQQLPPALAEVGAGMIKKYLDTKEELTLQNQIATVAGDHVTANCLQQILFGDCSPGLEEKLCKCLLTGYFDQSARSMKSLQGRADEYLLLFKQGRMEWKPNPTNTGQIKECKETEVKHWRQTRMAFLDNQSMLSRPGKWFPKDYEPVDLVFAVNLFEMGGYNESVGMTLMNKLDPTWLQDQWILTSYLHLHESEDHVLEHYPGKDAISIKPISPLDCYDGKYGRVMYAYEGPAQHVIQHEHQLLKHLKQQNTTSWTLTRSGDYLLNDEVSVHDVVFLKQIWEHNLKQIEKSRHIFNAYKNLQNKTRQIELKDSKGSKEWTWQAQQLHSNEIEANLNLFASSLNRAVAVQAVEDPTTNPTHKTMAEVAVQAWDRSHESNAQDQTTPRPVFGGSCSENNCKCSPPRTRLGKEVTKTQTNEKICYTKMVQRIRNCTDPSKPQHEQWEAVNGVAATRVSRMEAVAWLAVVCYGLRCEGGFVCDWIVGGITNAPNWGDPWDDDWGQLVGPVCDRPELHSLLVPQGLDVQIPASVTFFDLKRFLHDVSILGVQVSTVHVDSLLTVIMFDYQNKDGFGPFTMEFLHPHMAITHTNIDFDVNNLFLSKGFTKELGFRVPVPWLNLEEIIAGINAKQLTVMLPSIDSRLRDRIEQRKLQGWEVIPYN